MSNSKIDAAILAAAAWHSGQRRDGDDPLPYFTHPIEVLVNLRVVGGVTDEDFLCAAVLHDVLEETSATEDDVEAVAGRRARELVVELTREEPAADQTKGMSKSEIWQLRSEMLLGEIGKMSAEAQQIKLADRLSNLREAHRTKSGEKRARYEKQTHEILRIVARKVNPGLWEAIRKELET